MSSAPARLAVCMMVRDEQSMLPGALDSIVGLADELVVVDTGSQDATMDLVRAWSRRHAEVRVVLRSHSWQKDFSLHRNQTLKYATSDWCLILDADERLAPMAGFEPVRFKTWLAGLDRGRNALALQLEDIQEGRQVMTCNQARLFRRGQVRYQGRVHNRPVFAGPLYVLCHELHLRHLGYGLAQDRMRAKFQRSTGLLREQLAADPQDHQSLFYLCQQYGMQGRLPESIKWGERYLRRRQELGSQFNPTVYFTLARAHQAQGRPGRALKLIRQGLDDHPRNPDLALALADLGATQQRADLLAEGSRRHLAAHAAWWQDPAALGMLFYFSLGPQVADLSLLRLMLCGLGEGMQCLERLRARGSELDPSLRQQMQSSLATLGLDSWAGAEISLGGAA